jgi:hypothetical protein
VTKQLVTVYDIQIIDGRPVSTPITFLFDEKDCVQPENSVELYPSDELQQEAGRLNRSFNAGYFGD